MEEEKKTSANAGTQEGSKTAQDKQTVQPASRGGNTKVLGIIGYLFPILFFLPLVMEDTKNDDFAKFHANQQLAFLLFWIVLTAINIIPILGQLIFIVGWIFGLVLLVMGIINVSNDKKQPLPLIGGIQLIK